MLFPSVPRSFAAAVAVALAVACAATGAPKSSFAPRRVAYSPFDAPTSAEDAGPDAAPAPRAIVDRPMPPVLYAVSDIHGGYERIVALFLKHGILQNTPISPSQSAWAAGAATLVVIGDAIDKGPASLDVLELLRSLEAGAARAGGTVIYLLGNHEAEFLADPENDKAAKDGGIAVELRARGISPAAFASGQEPLGAWLATRPVAARVGSWFFAHAGDTHGMTLPALDASIRAAAARNGFADPVFVGADAILESRGWYGSDAAVTQRNAAALGVRRIVFGHDPNALGARGAIAVAYGGTLLRIDCGLSPYVNDSKGRLLRARREGAETVVESLSPDGDATQLFRE
jgi:hypothetical protein